MENPLWLPFVLIVFSSHIWIPGISKISFSPFFKNTSVGKWLARSPVINWSMTWCLWSSIVSSGIPLNSLLPEPKFPTCTQEKTVKYKWRAHKQLQDVINSAPGNGIIEWVPNDILGLDPLNEEDCTGFELKLLGFVFTNKEVPGS